MIGSQKCFYHVYHHEHVALTTSSRSAGGIRPESNDSRVRICFLAVPGFSALSSLEMRSGIKSELWLLHYSIS